MTQAVDRQRYVRRRLIALAALVVLFAAGLLLVRECRSHATGPDRGGANPIAGSAGLIPDPAGAVASAIYPKLTLHQRAGQRVVGAFNGRTIPSGLRQAIRKGHIGGLVLFSANLGSRRQIRKLTADLQRIPRPAGLRKVPLLITVDQEGGLVKRLAGAPQYSARTMGAKGAATARKQGVKTGRNLRNAGFNVDLAPVLDVARPGGVIDQTDRAFGRTAKRVGSVGVAFADGLRAGGVATTAKHFPGLGAASENTDFEVQRIRIPKKELIRKDLKPFGRFVKSGGELIMVGTAIYPPFGGKPAAFNRRIVVGQLRRRLGFPGVTVTDSLGATAARAFGGPGKTAVSAARAGIDLMLYGDWREALRGERAMARKLRAGKLDRTEFKGSVARILNLRAGLRNDR